MTPVHLLTLTRLFPALTQPHHGHWQSVFKINKLSHPRSQVGLGEVEKYTLS